MNSHIKIVVLGTRGFPEVQGGVEKHCEELYTRLVKLDCEVTVFTRKPYIPKDKRVNNWQGIKFTHIWCPKKKSLEAITHTFIGLMFSKRMSPDILHIHAIGPSLLVPFAKLLGFKVIVTNHGQDYNRQKWGKVAKFFLKLGERLGTKYADKVIAISLTIKEFLEKKYGRFDCELIFNGVSIPQKLQSDSYVKSLGLIPKKYILSVARFVEEKGLHDLIEAYSSINTECKLVLVGDTDHETDYSAKLKRLADKYGVIRTGVITGRKLGEIFTHALLFVLPSYHEGLPIALLEALSYDLDVLVSNISPNLELNLGEENYFEVGNVEDLKNKIMQKLQNPTLYKDWSYVLKKYDWDEIAVKTLKVYKSIQR